MRPGPGGPGGARWRASLRDYAAILCWLALLTVAGPVLRTVLPPAPSPPPPPVVADVVALLTVLPIRAFLTAGEAGRHAAGWGERRAGLRVVGPDGGPPGFGRVAVRNAVELLPWQFAHVAVARAILDPEDVGTMAVTYTLSLLIPRAASSWPGATPSTGRRTIASPAPGS
ncbi:hypothetical protein Gobs_2672 [Geodermatophilus obscurus DSM 43160]|uniref:RDD family protein n=1 Tax=Geodermatophilus obscurus (strain ATCC 25078 / DSM 43160 / JCM 3152 / CCUG 61914 / KCC A-0152 / KCTC 9177 / NBRC 13315 / NRRL B-3577 / G-20) TaxID=526225 RepID=D2S6D3_GEOOG|nr:hypothetical protein Gobs_2672 [Geodermatophilus obscurus DSM 43160]